MTGNFDRCIAALGTIDGLTVIETSEESTLDNYPLPAAVVDFAFGTFEMAHEGGDDYQERSSLTLVLHVALTDDRSVQRANLKTLFNQALQALLAEFDEVTIRNAYNATLPFGNGQAWVCGFVLDVGEQDYE